MIKSFRLLRVLLAWTRSSSAAERLVRAAGQDVADTRRAQRLALRQVYFELKLPAGKLRLV